MRTWRTPKGDRGGTELVKCWQSDTTRLRFSRLLWTTAKSSRQRQTIVGCRVLAHSTCGVQRIPSARDHGLLSVWTSGRQTTAMKLAICLACTTERVATTPGQRKAASTLPPSSPFPRNPDRCLIRPLAIWESMSGSMVLLTRTVGEFRVSGLRAAPEVSQRCLACFAPCVCCLSSRRNTLEAWLPGKTITRLWWVSNRLVNRPLFRLTLTLRQ